MPDADQALTQGEGALDPVEVAKVGLDPDLVTPRFQDANAQDVFAQPGGRTRCPPVAEAVAEALVAVVAEIAMDVLLALRHEFIDAGGVLGPGQVEILPEAGRAQVQHGAPVLTDAVQAALDIPSLGAGLEDVVPVEGAHACSAPDGENLLVKRSGVLQVGQSHQGCRLLAGTRVRDVLAQTCRRVPAALGLIRFLKHITQLGPCVQGHHEQGVQPRVRGLFVGAGRPIQESGLRQLLAAFRIDAFAELL